MKLLAHLDTLPPADGVALREVVARLRAMPEQTPSETLPRRVMSALASERRRPQGPLPWWGAAAALLILCLGGLMLRRFPGSAGMPATASGGLATLAWLAGDQEPDGTWSPARHGGAEAYRPALTALSALALATDARARHAACLSRACDALAALQRERGAFGGAGREEAYNHVITSYAVARLLPVLPRLKPVLTRAVAYSRAQQSAEGGWDYTPGSAGNTALTAWQVRMLDAARRQGIAEAEIPLRKGLRWLRGSLRADGHVAYHRGSRVQSESLDALAAYALIAAGDAYPDLKRLGHHMAGRLAPAAANETPDCYRDYAKVLAFASANAPDRADALRQRMMAHCSDARDQWWSVGGRLYTATLTHLARVAVSCP